MMRCMGGKGKLRRPKRMSKRWAWTQKDRFYHCAARGGRGGGACASVNIILAGGSLG